MQGVTVERLGAQLFEAVRASGSVTDEHLAALHFLYDTHLIKALQIVDQGGVWCFQGADSGRRVFQVHGQSAENYVVFSDHYCSCQVRRGRAAGSPGSRRRRAAATAPRLPARREPACGALCGPSDHSATTHACRCAPATAWSCCSGLLL